MSAAKWWTLVPVFALAACTAHATDGAQRGASPQVVSIAAPADDPDRDGVRGALDRCPNAPEDIDHIADEDGCPEVDQDCDHIDDRRDVCATQPEDFDRWQDEDGCPDPDNDGDAIADRCDQCPSEPETMNGYQDSDGCPDRALVLIQQSTIRILAMVQFDRDSDQVQPTHVALIDEVARALNQHPQIQVVAVEGHASTDERDPQRLSLRRAERVLSELTQRRVDPGRLVARALGTTRPIADSRTQSGREHNRRVQWNIERMSERSTSASSVQPEQRECPPEPTITMVPGGCPLPQ